MNKRTVEHHRLMEHYFVPAALFALNVCLVHVIYSYATGSWDNYWHLATLTSAPIALGCALLLKHRSFLICSTLGYMVLLLCWP